MAGPSRGEKGIKALVLLSAGESRRKAILEMGLVYKRVLQGEMTPCRST